MPPVPTGASSLPPPTADAGPGVRIHLLDVGHLPFSDAALVVVGQRRILIDGAHPSNARPDGSTPSLAKQLSAILGEERPRLDLLVVSHTHLDHVGALPALVTEHAFDAKWALVSDPELGWGRAEGDDAISMPDPSSAALLAALREERLPASASDAAVDEWLADSVGLDVAYEAMLGTLAGRGTKVVRYGRDDAGPLAKDLDDIEIEVFGPTQAQLIATAKAIADRMAADARTISDARSVDAAVPVVDLYRALTGASTADAGTDRPGAFVNLQSIVLALGPKGRRALFTGDMQLADPGTRDSVINKELNGLRERLRKHRFAFVKLPHHGSHNGFDPVVATSFGRPDVFGIIGGSDAKGHPSRSVLELLTLSGVPFARTDRNGGASIGWPGDAVQIDVARGVVSDPKANDAPDGPRTPTSTKGAAPEAPPPQVLVPRVAAGATSVGAAPGVRLVADERDVEISVRLPHTRTSVRLTVEITPESSSDPLAAQAVERTTAAVDVPTSRRPLLYVTTPQALARNIGTSDADAVLEHLSGQPGSLLTLEAAMATEAAIEQSREALAAEASLAGVVLIGGYDVVPPQSVDTVPPKLNSRIRRSRDGDSFVVWSDTNYGYRRDRRQLPVSRIPDGRLGSFLRTALAPPDAGAGPPRGVRNINRPFAEGIFSLVEGDQKLWVSRDATPATVGNGLSGELVYLMLHGSRVDGTRLWGEADDVPFEAVTLRNIGALPGAVVLVGACWGGLISDLRAIDYQDGAPIPPRSPENSIALACLAAGARAVIACTGSHYSPVREPYDYFGGPLHRDFLKAYLDGSPPALALLTAKQAYAAAMPHGLTDPDDEAIEYKMIWQFTCLGLGW